MDKSLYKDNFEYFIMYSYKYEFEIFSRSDSSAVVVFASRVFIVVGDMVKGSPG